MSQHQPGLYEKNGDVRVAYSQRDVVALEFDGFKPVDEAPTDEPVNAEPIVMSTPAVVPYDDPNADDPDLLDAGDLPVNDPDF